MTLFCKHPALYGCHPAIPCYYPRIPSQIKYERRPAENTFTGGRG
jgi:hypothetical protein